MASNHSIVFLSGWGFHANIGQSIKQHFPNTILLDLPLLDLSRNACDLSTITTYLAKHIPQQSIIIAWSMSGLFAIELCHVYREHYRQLILINSLPYFAADHHWPAISRMLIDEFIVAANQNLTALFQRFLHLTRYPSRDTQLKMLLEQHCIDPTEMQLMIYLTLLFNTDVRQQYSELSIPLTLFFATHDAIIPQEIIPHVSQLNPQAQLHIFSDAGHASFLTEQTIFSQLLQELKTPVPNE